MNIIFYAVVAVGLVGCAGEIVTYKSASNACEDGRCKGVPFHPLEAQDETYYQDKILDKEGNVTHFAGGDDGAACLPVRVQETKLVPTREPSYVYYDARTFESSAFNAEFGANAALTKVGSESTPGPKAAAEAVGAIATSVQVLKGANVLDRASSDDSWGPPEAAFSSGIPACNAGKIPVSPPKNAPAPVIDNCGKPGQKLCTG